MRNLRKFTKIKNDKIKIKIIKRIGNFQNIF